MGLIRAVHLLAGGPADGERGPPSAAAPPCEPCLCVGTKSLDFDEPGLQALAGAFIAGVCLLPFLDLIGVLRRCWVRCLGALERKVALWLAGASGYRVLPSGRSALA